MNLRRLDSRAEQFLAQLDALCHLDAAVDADIAATVAQIIRAIRQEGDTALLRYTADLDRQPVSQAAALSVSAQELAQAFDALPRPQRDALDTAAHRIRDYHERQAAASWEYTDDTGATLGQIITPLDRVGLYVPGGRAAYPSSVLMNALPAKVAGVGELIMVTPTPDGEKNPLVLAAAYRAGVDRVFTIGGAQAIAALAYGTATIPRVDKIVGPGNAYVACAKRQVFGAVGIDMIAGPSEVLIIADHTAHPDWVALDLFAQAEHDPWAQSIVLCPDPGTLDAIALAIERWLPQMPRQALIGQSLARRGALIAVRDLDEACTLANRIAPEHLELAVEAPRALLPRLRHAGAIFLGHHACESIGDYCAGPNHVLPTAGSARFSSPLGVYDFQKRTSLIELTPDSAKILGKTAQILAQGEGLVAHAQAAALREGAQA
jgi:histidinol dehydrogenase